MKKIPVTVHVPMPESLSEAIQTYGLDAVFKDYMTGLHLNLIQRMHAAGKIKYEK